MGIDGRFIRVFRLFRISRIIKLGRFSKSFDLLAKGKAIDYEGATAVQFTDVGEAAGAFLEKEIKGGKFKTKKQR